MKRKQKKGFKASPITVKQRKYSHIGSVFIVPDHIFNPSSPERMKPRRAVLVSKAGGNIYLAPVRRISNQRIALSNFDGSREIVLEKTKMVPRDKVFSKKHFPGTSNDYLSKKEKIKLRKALLKKKRPT